MSRTYKDMTPKSMNRFAESHGVEHTIARNPWTGEVEDLGACFGSIPRWAAARSKHSSQSRGRSNGHGLDMAALARHTRDISHRKDENHGRLGYGKLSCSMCADTRQQNYRDRHEVRDELIYLRKRVRGIAAEQMEADSFHIIDPITL